MDACFRGDELNAFTLPLRPLRRSTACFPAKTAAAEFQMAPSETRPGRILRSNGGRLLWMDGGSACGRAAGMLGGRSVCILRLQPSQTCSWKTAAASTPRVATVMREENVKVM